MFILNKVLLAVTMLIGVETLTIAPARGLSFNFHLTSPPPYGLGDFGTDGTLKLGNIGANQYGLPEPHRFVEDLPPGYLSVALYPSTSKITLGNKSSISGPYFVERKLFGEWLISSTSQTWDFGSYFRVISWEMKIFCGTNLLNCNGAMGSFLIRDPRPMPPIYPSPIPPIYQSGITVDNFSPSSPLPPPPPPPPPPNRVPEPSLLWGLLLLGSGLLWKNKSKAIKS
ncbi:MAG TPA: PEP-CTERM sorting domain-containing protein [Leptolyngbyaceae cyanobacterium]